MKNMRDQNILITGASSGLGEALDIRFAEQGANLTLNARRVLRLESLRDKLLQINDKIEIFLAPGDISNKSSCEQIIKDSIGHFSRLDAFIANAGQGMWSRFSDLRDPDELKSLMDLNYMGVVYGLFYALPELRRVHGSFVAISSIQG